MRRLPPRPACGLPRSDDPRTVPEVHVGLGSGVAFHPPERQRTRRAEHRRGTCANMPVLYAAIGRALGYPLYLVSARGHLFCRWQSARTGERFNVEASGIGLNTNADEFYYKWPRPITEAEVYHGIFLRNFDPAEELGCFMATRGHVLQDRGHVLDAIVAYSHAHRLSPMDPTCTGFQLDMLNKEIDMRRDAKMPSSYRQAENFKPEVYASPARVVIDDRYILRAVGAIPECQQSTAPAT